MLDNVGRILSSFTNISMTDDKCLVDIHIVTLKVTVVVENQSNFIEKMLNDDEFMDVCSSYAAIVA